MVRHLLLRLDAVTGLLQKVCHFPFLMKIYHMGGIKLCLHLTKENVLWLSFAIFNEFEFPPCYVRLLEQHRKHSLMIAFALLITVRWKLCCKRVIMIMCAKIKKEKEKHLQRNSLRVKFFLGLRGSRITEVFILFLHMPLEKLQFFSTNPNLDPDITGQGSHFNSFTATADKLTAAEQTN